MVAGDAEAGSGGAATGDEVTFRRAMTALAAGVTIVTTRDRRGQPCGLTATAVSLVSQEPPLLLACVGHRADCHGDFLDADAFAVNVLREGQEELSRRFARKDREKFAGVSFETGRLGVPVLPGVLAVVECRVEARHPAGDHTILIGRAEAWRLTTDETVSPLIWYRRGYHRLTAL